MKFILVLSLIALTSFSLAVEDEDVARRERIIANTLAQQEEIWKRFGVDPRMDQEATMSVPELIQGRGYPVEVHNVQTSDGYILEIHRIPYGKKSGPASNKKVVFVMHGILQSSADWVITSEDKGLGYILADEGFDVWLGNARGTKYSRNHTTLNPDKSDFWKFSWHEIGSIDLPTQIDYILEHTGGSALHYVGYSQGTTSYFVMASSRPEYNKKIKVATLMAPIAYMGNMYSPIIRIAAQFQGFAETLLSLFGVNEFLPSNSLLATVGDLLCGDDSITQILCTNGLFAICGFSASEMNATLLPTLMGHSPAGSSVRQIYHYGQEIKSSKFRQYDYGFFKNLAEYGSSSPPNYDYSKITSNIYLFYSSNDWMADTGDVEKFCDKLSFCERTLVSKSTWNHLDFTYGINAKRLVYDKLVSILKRH